MTCAQSAWTLLTLGQYLRPTVNHLAVQRYVSPSEFDQLRGPRCSAVLWNVSPGPSVRSSYRAEQALNRNNAGPRSTRRWWLSPGSETRSRARELIGPTPILRYLGRTVDYCSTWRRMQQFNETRTALSADELWVLEHPPRLHSLGLAGRREHLLAPGDIPIVHSDRGGQVTYHGPGQLVVYALIDLRRAGLGVRDLLTGLEQAVVRYAAQLGIAAAAKPEAPGGVRRGA